MDLLFQDCLFCWTLSFYNVQFPIISAVFLCHYHLMMHPTANRLVDIMFAQVLSINHHCQRHQCTPLVAGDSHTGCLQHPTPLLPTSQDAALATAGSVQPILEAAIPGQQRF
jgi:hypothetical protein